MSSHFITMWEFMCPSDPTGYVVQGLLPPGRVFQGKLVLGERPDEEQFQQHLWKKYEENSLPWLG